MSSETLLRTTSSSFLSHLVVDTPSAGGRLTPSFFNSIFNDGMNPFDESFTSIISSTPSTSGLAMDLNTTASFGKMKPSPLSNDKTAVMLPNIEIGKVSESDLLRRRPMSPLSPPISPDDPDVVIRSPILSNTRSPSPFSYSNPFSSTPSPSTSPITSPDEPNSSGATPIIKREEEFTPILPVKQARRRTICNGDAQRFSAGQPAPKKVEKATAPRQKSVSISTNDSVDITEPETKPVKPRQPTRAGRPKQASQEVSPAPKASNNAPAAGRKRKSSAIEPKEEEEEEEEEEEGSDVDHQDDGNSNKRARFLERNRIAASKCRKKKKLMNQRLEEKSRLLHQHNRYLNQLVSSLKSDVLRLKQCLLVHHNCEDEPIKRYLQCEAGKVFNPLSMDDKMDKVATPILKSEPKASPDNRALLEELEKDRIDDLNDKWTNMAARNHDFDAEFRSFQEVESAALGRLGKHSELSYDEELKMLFGDDMSL